LAGRGNVIRGGWSATLTGGETLAPSAARSSGPGSIQTAPAPTRSWSAPRWQPGGGVNTSWSSGATGYAPAPAAPAPAGRVIGGWNASVSSGGASATAQQPGAAMAKALQPTKLQGFSKRKSLGPVVCLSRNPSSAELSEAIEAVYRQLLGRQPLASEQLGDAESQFRKGQLCVAEFVGRVAGSDLFISRLNRMVPFKAAAAAYLALLGRAAEPAETSRFLATRCDQGLRTAIEGVLNSQEYARSFGRDTVPHLKGMATSDGLPLSSVNRTAGLYGGNAALNPS